MHTHYPHVFVLMQRVQHAVIEGYIRYQFIHCSRAKAAALAMQFEARYETEVSKYIRHRRKQAGIARARFFSVLDDDAMVRGFLMATKGAGLIEGEAMHDPSKSRIVLGAYELVHDGIGWSWRFTNRAMKDWRSRVHSAIARGDTQGLQQIVRYLYRTAGFRLVRRQVGELASYIRGEWRRLQKGKPPELPRFLPYIRRLPDNWTPNALDPALGPRGK